METTNNMPLLLKYVEKISNITDLLRTEYLSIYGLRFISASPACGLLYSTTNSPYFISGHLRFRGRDNGRYPFNYLEMIDTIFGKEDNTIEVCSGSVKGNSFTVDINPDTKPDLVTDGQELYEIPNDIFCRWRCDPPYNVNTAEKMYRTKLPNTQKLLKADARVCKVGSLMFLLLGQQNYQMCPPGV
ncbi:MAG: hypothetical protein GEU26_06410 [Nitrososphaeraceae archaeon]|nr:hypothetical protein [Nitrososphaeraceae archaeon]